MKRVLTIGMAGIAVLALAVAPALALQERGPAGQSGERGGAAARPSGGDVGSRGGGGAGAGGGSAVGSAGGGTVGGGGGSGSVFGGGGSTLGGARRSADGPGSSRARGGDVSRSNPNQGSTGRVAVPRGGTSGAAAGGRTAATAGGSGRNAAPVREVPQYSRPRGERPRTGQAVARGQQRVPGGGVRYPGYYYPDYWYWYQYGYGYPYYGSFGLGFFYYDPTWWGYPGANYGGYYSADRTGTLRLKVKPRDAEVHVDGYFVGTVDQFDGVFQRLHLETGGHRIEIRAVGYEPLVFDVMIPSFETVTYTGELKKKMP